MRRNPCSNSDRFYASPFGAKPLFSKPRSCFRASRLCMPVKSAAMQRAAFAIRHNITAAHLPQNGSRKKGAIQTENCKKAALAKAEISALTAAVRPADGNSGEQRLKAQPFRFLSVLNIDSFDFENNRSRSVITASYHKLIIIGPSMHNRTALKRRVDIPADAIPGFRAKRHAFRTAMHCPGRKQNALIRLSALR